MLSYYLVDCMVYCMESKADVVPMEPIIVKTLFWMKKPSLNLNTKKRLNLLMLPCT